MESMNSLRISAPQWWPLREGRDGKCEGRNEKCEFLARESVSSSPIVWIFGKGKCKFIANFSATMVTSLPSLSISLSVSLSLSLSPKVPHASALPIIGSASALPIIQPTRTKCSWTATLTGKLSSFGFDPRRSSNFTFCFSTLGLSLTARAEAMASQASIGESCWCHKLLCCVIHPTFFIWSGGPVVSEETRAK